MASSWRKVPHPAGRARIGDPLLHALPDGQLIEVGQTKAAVATPRNSP
jgi:hypothetical protein